jgi:multidrug transporter EmrE-like cation transporter
MQQALQSWWLIALSILAGVGGQVAIKLGVSQGGWKFDWLSFLPPLLQSPLTLFGLALYGIGAVSWIAVLKRIDLSYAYPFLALNFVLIALASGLLLGESIPTMRWFGLGLICLGIVLVARGGA